MPTSRRPPLLTSARGGGIFVCLASHFSLPCAMEFGGHHRLLGRLVMKHGRHKDLAKLASLARIERVMGAWATFAIDLLPHHPPATTPPPPGGSALGRPRPPPLGGLATSPHATEPAGVTGPPCPAPAVQCDAARHGGRNAVARSAYWGLVVGRPAAGRRRRRAINPARARRRGAAGAVGAGGRVHREGY